MATAMKVWPQVGRVDQCSGKRHVSTRRRLTLGGATLPICSMLAIGMASEAPLILYPITPSLPPGKYVRNAELLKDCCPNGEAVGRWLMARSLRYRPICQTASTAGSLDSFDLRRFWARTSH